MSETRTPVRVIRTSGVLYAEPVKARRRRRCDGHMADPHWIEIGAMVVHSACPPDHNDIGNIGWRHHSFCADCAPEATS